MARNVDQVVASVPVKRRAKIEQRANVLAALKDLGGDRARKRKAVKKRVPSRMDVRRLDRLIEEAVVDAYNESEQRTAFYTMLGENLDVPFTTEILGVEVSVQRVDLTDSEEIIVICARGRNRLAIPILELPLPVPPPKGSEWIEAYRRWVRRR